MGYPPHTTGFLLINKPSGPTSHDIVDAVRRIVRPPHSPPSQGGNKNGTSPLRRGSKRGSQIRVGHAGTLDPFAKGLLIVGVGRESTRRLDQFKNLPKTYRATLRLGATSDTDDRTGKIEESGIKNLELRVEEIVKTLQSFVGEIEQVPPTYSAKKVGGEKLYELARQGKMVERKAVKITIYSITQISFTPLPSFPALTFTVTCSAGTYIRALARDIGERLGCGAYLEELIRTKIGTNDVKDTVTLDKLTPKNWHHYLLTDKLPTDKLKTVVLGFGTFDLLHRGHLDFFRQARRRGNYLIVGVGRDTVVAAIKGHPPRQDETTRLNVVQSCGLVDEALLLPENPEERFLWIKKIAPAIIALGYDQTAFTENLETDLKKYGIQCRVVRLQPYQPELYKSSKQY